MCDLLLHTPAGNHMSCFKAKKSRKDVCLYASEGCLQASVLNLWQHIVLHQVQCGHTTRAAHIADKVSNAHQLLRSRVHVNHQLQVRFNDVCDLLVGLRSGNTCQNKCNYAVIVWLYHGEDQGSRALTNECLGHVKGQESYKEPIERETDKLCLYLFLRLLATTPACRGLGKSPGAKAKQLAGSQLNVLVRAVQEPNREVVLRDGHLDLAIANCRSLPEQP